MKLPLQPLGGRVPNDADATENASHLASLEDALREKRDVVREGWDPNGSTARTR